MATVKVKLRPSTVEGKPGTIVYIVSHKGIAKHITTKIRALPSEWDNGNACFIPLQNHTCILQNKIDADISLLRRIISEENIKHNNYTAEEIIAKFRNPDLYISITDFFEQQIQFLKECRRHGTARNYRMVSNSINSFLEGKELYFNELTPGFVERFADYLRKRGMVKNSLSFYMRIFRAVFNKGVRLGLTEQTFPFRDTYTGIDKTRKRSVKENILCRLLHLDLSDKKYLAFARDMFLFSFYTRGMSYVDMAFLRKEDITDGTIRYARHKTGHYMIVKLETCMKEIIERYKDKTKESPYVFPIIKSEDAEQSYYEYRSALRVYNLRLKKISNILDILPALSSYTARHSWATTARNHNIPISVISAGMGHSSEKTTQIYLNSIENTLIDKANRGILQALK